MNVPFNDLGAQLETIREDVFSAMKSVVERSAFVDGPEIGEFEQGFSRFCSKNETQTYCAAVSNGTDAVMLALLALGIGAGDEVIVPAQSFIATIEPLFYLGARPIFVDTDPRTFNIDPKKIEAAITPRTKAIVAVHLYGLPCSMREINAIAERHDLWVIEDSAQGHGAEVGGIRTGLLGDIAAFSFYPGKNLGAFGDAGAVVSRDPMLIEQIRRLANHGRDRGKKYTHSQIGFNCRMDTIQAAILNVKLKMIERWTQRRREIANRYSTELSQFVKTPFESEGMRHVYHLYVLDVENRDQFLEELKQKGVQASVHYPLPMHLHEPVQAWVGTKRGQCPTAERSANRVLSLPIYPEMTDAKTEYVIESVKSIARRVR